MTDLSPSRRNVIAAMFAAPLVAAAPTFDDMSDGQAPSRAWEQLVMAEIFARDALQRYQVTEQAAVYSAHEAGTASFEEVQIAERRFEALLSQHWSAIDELMAEPSPNMSAVLYKMELATKVDLFDEFADVGPAILGDMRRLAGRA